MKNGLLWVLGAAAVVGVVILRKKILSAQDEFLTQITGKSKAARDAQVNYEIAVSRAGWGYGEQNRAGWMQYDALIATGTNEQLAASFVKSSWPMWDKSNPRT